MNRKIKIYVDGLFSDIPPSKEANKLKTEILSLMSENFENYIQEGKTENQAYNLVVTNLVDIDERLAEVRPTDDFIEEARYFRRRNAKNIAIGVALYIIGGAFLLGFGGFGAFLGNQDFYGLIGLLSLLVISAVATGLIVYTNLSTPLEYKNYKNNTDYEFENLDSKHARLLNNILTIYWIIVTFIYLVVSFLTGRWDITWLIWILATVFQLILRTGFELKFGND